MISLIGVKIKMLWTDHVEWSHVGRVIFVPRPYQTQKILPSSIKMSKRLTGTDMGNYMHNDVTQSLLYTPTFNHHNSHPYWGCRYPWASILAKMLPRQSEPCSAKWVGKHSLVRRSKAWKALDGRWESRSIKYLENHQRLRKIMVRPYSSAEGNACVFLTEWTMLHWKKWKRRGLQ